MLVFPKMSIFSQKISVNNFLWNCFWSDPYVSSFPGFYFVKIMYLPVTECYHLEAADIKTIIILAAAQNYGLEVRTWNTCLTAKWYILKRYPFE